MLKKMLLASGGNKGIQFVGGYSVGYAGGTIGTDRVVSLTSLTGGIDTQPSAGDIVVIINGWCSSATNITPAGYTTIFNNIANDSYPSSGGLSYKIMGSTPDTSATIKIITGATNSGSASILVFRNVNQTNPIDVTSQVATTANTAKPNPPSITPVTDGAIIVCGGVAGHSLGADLNLTSSDLTNFIEAGYNTTYDCSTGIGYKEWTGGAFDAAQFGSNSDSASYSSIGYSMVLRPQ